MKTVPHKIQPSTGNLNFEEMLRRLPPAKLRRLIEIRKAYPDTPLERLPKEMKGEVVEILQSTGTSSPRGESGQINNPTGNYSRLYSIIGRDAQKDTDVRLSQEDRRQGLYIIGATGTGKSTLIANLLLTDIREGLGVCLIEPHGDLTHTVIAGIPEPRLKDVIYLDMTDSKYPFGLNLFQCHEPRTMSEMEVTANFVHHVFAKIWGAGTDTPRLMQVLRAVTRTLIENPGTTFAEIPLLFSSDTVRAKMVANLTNSSIASFWEDYERKMPRLKDEYIESTKNKVMSFLDSPMVRNIVAQERTTVNFRDIMDSGKILLVKLSPQFEEASMLIGAIIIGKLLMAAFSRSNIKEEKRRQLNLFCDEYQRFATSDFATLIAEARKFRIATTLSHQTLAQIDEANKTAALAAGNLIVFRVSGEDAKDLAKNFDTTPIKEAIGEEPSRAPVSDVIGHLVKRGHHDPRVTQFAQGYLKSLENFITHPAHVGIAGPPANVQSAYAWLGVITFEHYDIDRARELLNESLYRSMIERSDYFLIPPLALYMLAVAQQDGSDQVFNPYIKTSWWDDLHKFQGFEKGAEVFGDPYFISKDFCAKFVDSRWKKEKEAVRALVKVITELRYTMTTLAQQPIMVDTGQYQPKYQNRTFADMENEIARDLTQQPNFQAKVKLLSGEHVIQTKDLSHVLSGYQLSARIEQIKRQMRDPNFGYCRYYKQVEREIRERREKWRGGGSEEPPPTHA